MNGKQLRNSILQWAIQGKLVPQDPNDEPASVLLERIREEKARLVKEKKIKRDKNESIIYRGDDNSYYEKILATGEVKCIDDEIPFDLPNTWCWVRLDNVITLLSGRDLEPSQYNNLEKGIPYMTGASNFLNDELIVNRWTLSPTTISHKGELLITCKGTIGTMAFNVIGDIHIARQIMSISSNYINLNYLKLYLEVYVSELEKVARSIIPGISRNDILKAVFPVPPLNEQAKIVEFINCISPSISLFGKKQYELMKLNENIKPTLKKSILQEAIQGRLVAQCETDEPASLLLEKIKSEKQKLVKDGKLKKSALEESVIFKGDDNKYYEQIGKNCIDVTADIPFEIPGNWVWTRIGYLFAHNNGKQLNKGNSVGTLMEYITTSNLYWDGFRLDNLKRMPFEKSEIERCQAIKGDLLVCEGGDVGRSCIWTYDSPIMLQNHIHKLRAYLPLCTKFFYFIFYYYNLSGMIGGKGIGIKGFSSKALHNTLVPLPPIEEQSRIVAKIEKLLHLSD